MAFEQQAEFDYDALPLPTKYRFAEMEIERALHVTTHGLYQFDPDRNQKGFTFVFNLLFPLLERNKNEEAFQEVIRTHTFKRPHKAELINYFLYHNLSYGQIRTLCGVSPNTISKYRFQLRPHYIPVFDAWTPDMLARWESIKHALNLWDEELAHYRK